MSRTCWGAAALLVLLLAGNELWAQRPLRELRSRDFHALLLRELELQRRTPTPLFREIDPVFLLNEAAINGMVYDPFTGVLRWRYRLRPGVGRAVAARIVRRLQSFLVGNLIRAGLVTQAQIDAGEFRVEVLGGEGAGAVEEVMPPAVPERGAIGEGVEIPPPPPPSPRQPVENAPQTVATGGSVGYTSYYYPYYWGCAWGCWGYPWYWGCGWGGCGWFDGYYCCPGWGWGYPGWGYYPVAYPTAVAAYPAPVVMAASPAPVQVVATTSASLAPRPSRSSGQAQLAQARVARISLYGGPAREDSVSPAPTFWRRATGANPDGLFWDGYTLYWQGRYADALDSFEAALAERRGDARFWAYKALCERALGQTRAAGVSAHQARTLRAQGLPALEQIGSVLERVQGADRRFLNGEGDVLAGR